MKKMNKLSLLLLLFITVIVADATAQTLQGVNGRSILKADNYTDVVGSPFLTDGWAKGVVKLADGRTYKDILLSYNIMTDELLFKNNKGDTLAFVDPVKEFKLTLPDGHEKMFANGFKNIPNSTGASFFEVLGNGTTQLLKKTTKAINVIKPYNEAPIKRIEESIKYYLVVADKATQVKNDKKAILTALGNKQPELEAYIKTNNLNFKNDEDMGKLITFYNSL